MSDLSKKNWIITPDGDTINLDYLSTIQLDSATFTIYFVLGNNLGDGTSGSNAILNYVYGDLPTAEAAYAVYQKLLKDLAIVTDLQVATATVTTVTANTGAAAGGYDRTIDGTGFHPGCQLTFGGNACTFIRVMSETQIIATVPAHAAGAVDIVYTDINTTIAPATLAGGFTYV